MNILKKLTSFLVAGMLTVTAALIIPSSAVTASAMTYINDPSVFIKQDYSYTCTLASNVMMLRRASILMGDADWTSITESALRPLLWNEQYGMYNYYTYNGIKVSFEKTKNPYSSGNELIEVLKKHPEGIVAYDYDHPHAILLTDYMNGVFYCADPANSVPSGRIRSTESLIDVNGVEAYWYVESPDLSGARIDNEAEQWMITADDGVNLRSGAGLSNAVKGFVPKGAVVSVTAKKSADSFTWGYVKYDSVYGWIALDFARQYYSEELVNTSRLGYKNLTLGDRTLIHGSATGGSGVYEYSYSYQKLPDSRWICLKDYSGSGSVRFKPSSTGEYYIRVKVHDMVTGTVKQKGLQLNVNDGIVNESYLGADQLTLHNSIRLHGAASGGTGSYKYAYYCRKASSTGWYVIKDYSSSKSVSYTPVAAVDYDFMIRVRDSKGRVAQKQFRLTVSPALVNRSKLSSVKVTYGEPITLTASASGGTGGYEYAYFCKKSDADKWYAIRRYSDQSCVEYTTKSTGEYDFVIKVKDSSGAVSKKFFTVNVYRQLRNSSGIVSDTIVKGGSFELYGRASGGTGEYQYAYYCRKSGSTGWYTIQGYSSSTSAVYKPVAAVDYEIMIRVKDSSGKVTEKLLNASVKRA